MKGNGPRSKNPLTSKALQAFKSSLFSKKARKDALNPLFLKAHMGQFQGLPFRPN